MEIKWSEERNELAAALATAQGKIKTAPKDCIAKVKTKSGAEYSYKYSSLDAIWEVARKPLADGGLSVIQIPTNGEGGFALETILMHSSGQWVSGTMALPIVADRMSEVQSMGSAITYARRYMLAAMVGITTGEDDDGQAAAPAVGRNAKKQPAAPAPPTNGQSKPLDEFLGRTTIELGLKDEEARAILKELGYEGFKVSQADEYFDALKTQLQVAASTPTALMVLANTETGGHYKHLKHLENTAKKLIGEFDLGIEYPPPPDEVTDWQDLLRVLIDHGTPKE